jgi:hypothetical protein
MYRRGMNINVGDEVRVKPASYRRHDKHPRDGYPGRITKVARKYATAEYTLEYADSSGLNSSTRIIEFDMETGRERDNNTNYPAYVYTPEMMDRKIRWEAALAILKDGDLEIRLGRVHSFTLEYLEALAEVIEAHRADAT